MLIFSFYTLLFPTDVFFMVALRYSSCGLRYSRTPPPAWSSPSGSTIFFAIKKTV